VFCFVCTADELMFILPAQMSTEGGGSRTNQARADLVDLGKNMHAWNTGALIVYICNSVADPNPYPDPDPLDAHVFGLPGSGSISHRYGSGSGFLHAKVIRKTLIPTIL
jgi:hypothetical protein